MNKNFILIFLLLLNICVCILYVYIYKIKINTLKDIYFSRLNLSKEFNKIYSTLYFEAKNGKTKKPFYNKNYIIKNYNNTKIKGICLCTLCKNENLYLKEFIEYYKLLGFDKIIIFDNNNIDGEKLEDVLKDYIQSNFVKIIDIRGIIAVQIPVFNYCYQKYNKLFDWIAFFDFDEFLFINGSKTINNYIYNKKFEKCQTILFNWIFYNDNNFETYENKPILERFKNPKKKASRVKSIVRGDIKNLIIPSSHIIGINIDYFCNSNGMRIIPQTFYDIHFANNNNAYIKHFYTKTAEEFCNKINKGDVQFHRENLHYKNIIKSKLKFFFSINKITKKKIKILENCLNLKLDAFYKKKINKK